MIRTRKFEDKETTEEGFNNKLEGRHISLKRNTFVRVKEGKE
jgi:hypothetical protein